MRRLIALVTGLLLVAGCGQATTPEAPKPWVKVGDGPVGVAADAAGRLWVVGSNDNSLSSIDSAKKRPTADRSTDIGSTPLRVATGYDAVWVTSFRDGRLLKVDPRSSKVLARTPVGAGSEGVATGFGAVWVVAQDAGLLLKIRPSDGAVLQRIKVGVGARLVATDEHQVWVSQFGEQRVLRIEPANGKVTRSAALCTGPQGLAPTPTRLWVTCTGEDKVLALDPSTLEVLATVAVPGQPDPVRVAPDGFVLVGVEDGPSLVRIDPTDGRVVSTKRLGQQAPLYDRANIDLALTDKLAWLTSFNDGRLYRVRLG